MTKLFSEDYEKALLGSMLLDNSIISDAMSLVKKQYFNNYNHQAIFEEICNIYDEHGSCDIVMLSQRIPEIVDLIAGLTSVVASTKNFEFYAMEIRKLYTSRMYKQFVNDRCAEINKDNIDEILSETDDFVFNCLNSVSRIEPTDSRSIAVNVIESIKKAYANKGVMQGYTTGYTGLDELTDGIHDGDLCIIGARPSIGKSAFADQVQMNMAMHKVKTCMFSYEMTEKEIGLRRTGVLSGIPIKKLKSGFLVQQDFPKIMQACDTLSKTDMLLYDSSKISFNFSELVSKIRIHAKQGYKAFFIDHIGLLEYDQQPNLENHEKISKMTKKLRKLASTLNIAIIPICQLVRDAEGKEPMLNSLRGSGSIEQDATIVMFIHRDRQQRDEAAIPAKVMVVKDRDGACGEVALDFIPFTTKFREVKPETNRN